MTEAPGEGGPQEKACHCENLRHGEESADLLWVLREPIPEVEIQERNPRSSLPAASPTRRARNPAP
jgi:hypothetical protein